jgi:ATP-dependent DNA ligase
MAIYVEPRVDAEIRFLTIDSSGLLRHATYRGLSE